MEMLHKMNIFYLHKDPQECARLHCDKHVVKMIIEYAQLLSTTHRVLDGELFFDKSKNGRKLRRFKLLDERDQKLMLAVHENHPSNIWLRKSRENYMWLWKMWYHLNREYTYRYGKIHSCMRLLMDLVEAPKNIPNGKFTPPTPAMPEECKITGDSLGSYHKYYIEKKNYFAKWTKREIPSWYTEGLNKYNANIPISQ